MRWRGATATAPRRSRTSCWSGSGCRKAPPEAVRGPRRDPSPDPRTAHPCAATTRNPLRLLDRLLVVLLRLLGDALAKGVALVGVRAVQLRERRATLVGVPALGVTRLRGVLELGRVLLVLLVGRGLLRLRLLRDALAEGVALVGASAVQLCERTGVEGALRLALLGGVRMSVLLLLRLL